MRSGTHFTQQNVFLLFTVVVTKHVWPYFQSRFPKTSSGRVSSWYVSGMKQKFGFVNVSGNAFSDITDACVNAEYSAPSPLAVM